MISKGTKFEYYRSRIEEIASEHMAIAMPMSKGYPILLLSGQSFFGKAVADGGTVHQFTSIYLDKIFTPIPLWIVTLPTNITKIQQRAFVRLDVSLPVELEFTNETAESSSITEKLLLSTKDVSGGGLRVISKKPMKLGIKMNASFNLPETGIIHAVGEVVRVDQPDESRPIYWIGIRFLNILETDRTKIIRHIFKKQLELRRKGV